MNSLWTIIQSLSMFIIKLCGQWIDNFPCLPSYLKLSNNLIVVSSIPHSVLFCDVYLWQDLPDKRQIQDGSTVWHGVVIIVFFCFHSEKIRNGGSICCQMIQKGTGVNGSGTGTGSGDGKIERKRKVRHWSTLPVNIWVSSEVTIWILIIWKCRM